MVFNMGSATDCPNRGRCQAGAKCYALRDETVYKKDCLNFHRLQGAYWESITAELFAELTIEKIGRGRGKKINELRFNEAGDMKTENDVLKLEKIAQLLQPAGVTVYTYTATKQLKPFIENNVKTAVVNGSGFTIKGKIFKLFKKGQKVPRGWVMCRGKCEGCNYCKTSEPLKIAIVEH